ncbi:MAG: DNA polymerase Y family protein [Gammaproteobacteria bacterium]|nr:DNA polymerase Y family protein [Gammaproteobacteria bacterium]
MLWLGLYLPRLALEIFARADDRAPFAIVDGEGRNRRVVMVNDAGRRAGIDNGMSVAAAHTLAHDLQLQTRDIVAERALLERLAAWALQFTSIVSLVPPQALVLEVEGSCRLFISIERLLYKVRCGLDELGFAAQLALAPTPLAATWLASAGAGSRVIHEAELASALARLPLKVLDLAAEERALLARVGVLTLGHVQRLPRAGLRRRLGPMLVDVLDRALGRTPDPRVAFVPPAHYHGVLSLPAPVLEAERLLFALHRLLRELEGFMLARNAGTTELKLMLRHAHRPATVVDLNLTQPTRRATHLQSLFRELLGRTPLPEAVEEIVLDSGALMPMVLRNDDLFRSAKSSTESTAALIDRLSARLGREAVRGIDAVADHRPERAWRTVSPGAADSSGEYGQRPLWLLPEPLALTTKEAKPWLDGPLTLAPDRERIESGWWDGDDITRDYYVAHHPGGGRFWVYRQLGDGAWFLHGIFG